jgi:hypothetical protein
LTQQLFYAIEMHELGWDVQFYKWNTFKNAVCGGKGAWKKLCEADMVIGGADLSGDYMQDDIHSPLWRYPS